MRLQRFPALVVPSHCLDAIGVVWIFSRSVEGVECDTGTAGRLAGLVVTSIPVTGCISHGEPRQMREPPEPADSSSCMAS